MLNAMFDILSAIATAIAVIAICVAVLLVVGVLAALLFIAASGKHPTKKRPTQNTVNT